MGIQKLSRYIEPDQSLIALTVRPVIEVVTNYQQRQNPRG
jgi:hypothetical protein